MYAWCHGDYGWLCKIVDLLTLLTLGVNQKYVISRQTTNDARNQCTTGPISCKPGTVCSTDKCGFTSTKTINTWTFAYFCRQAHTSCGGTVASWLVHLTLERAVRVRALAGDIVLCSWARHFTLTVPLSTQVYKWVPANCWGNLTKLWGNDLRWTSIPSRGSRNTSIRFMLQKPG